MVTKQTDVGASLNSLHGIPAPLVERLIELRTLLSRQWNSESSENRTKNGNIIEVSRGGRRNVPLLKS